LRRNAIDCGLEKTGGPHALLCRKLSTPRAPTWYAIPVRFIVGYGFMEHGWAKLARGPDSFAAILHALGMPVPGLLAWSTTMVGLIGRFVVLVGAFIPLAVVLLVATSRFTSQTDSAPSSCNPSMRPARISGSQVTKPTSPTLQGLVALMLGGSRRAPLHSQSRRPAGGDYRQERRAFTG
jgi:putative oxidoreductase